MKILEKGTSTSVVLGLENPTMIPENTTSCVITSLSWDLTLSVFTRIFKTFIPSREGPKDIQNKGHMTWKEKCCMNKGGSCPLVGRKGGVTFVFEKLMSTVPMARCVEKPYSQSIVQSVVP